MRGYHENEILGRTGLESLSLGLEHIHRQPTIGAARDLDEEMGARAVHAAIEAGCNLIDTAPL